MQPTAALCHGLLRAVLVAPFLFGGFCWVLAQTKDEGERNEAEFNRAKVEGPELRVDGEAPSSKLQDARDNADQDGFKYQGVRECNLCHGRGLQESDKEFNYLVQLNEFQIWSQDDKHRRAADVIYPDAEQRNLAYRMQQVLSEDRFAELFSDCQKCHDTGQPRGSKARGVTCEACHGGAEQWLLPHWREHWREKPLKEQEDAGMVNIHDPATKSRVCLSCHLGDESAGKVVTHEMYAAGHPPLGGFEAATYAIAMPAHWTPMRSKPEKYQRHHGQFSIHAPDTRQILLGGLSSLASYLKLFADYAKSPTIAKNWPELALYDCFACHHDLHRDSWRQARGYGDRKPGRPPLRAWPNVLARLALRQAGLETAVWAKVDRAAHAVGERPFGEPAGVAAAAAAAAQDIDNGAKTLKAALDRSSVTADEAKRQDHELTAKVLRGICELATSEYHDYDSARQLVWAFDLVYKEYAALSTDNSDRGAIDKIVEDLKTSLGADLRAQKQTATVPPTSDESQQARADYKAPEFKRKFQDLSARLSSK